VAAEVAFAADSIDTVLQALTAKQVIDQGTAS
jgi:hypothetical protein